MIQGQNFINFVLGRYVTSPSIEDNNRFRSDINKKSDPPASIEKPEENPEKKLDAEVKPVNKITDDALKCIICYNEVLGVLFLPCRHMVACTRCAEIMNFCLLCKKSVSMKVRATIS
ncbi:GSCOCG00000111001-RA-CDS [Cotesia congregata]|nr:GSCOCG00000111001-RA-CDS [Cotesia congregata]